MESDEASGASSAVADAKSGNMSQDDDSTVAMDEDIGESESERVGDDDTVDEDETSVAMPPPNPVVPVAAAAASASPKKMRIRLSLKPLPMSSMVPPHAKVATTNATKTMGSQSNKATAILTSPVVSKAKLTSAAPNTHFKRALPICKTATGTSSKRRSVLPPKQIRLPPLTSPGLLLLRPPTSTGGTVGGPKTTSNGSFLVTPQLVFDATMTNAGYTHEQRTNQPHRGSSVQRTIGDVFDTNVKLSLNVPELFPKELWNRVVNENEGEPVMLPQQLLAELEKAKPNGSTPRPHRKFTPSRMLDMIPVSLTVPYPEEFIQARLAYVDLVQKREKAIVDWQAAQEELDIRHEVLGVDEGDGTESSATNTVLVPSIPEPPEPPFLKDLQENGDGNATLLFTDYELENSSHPVYLPKGKEHFVSHLDRNCFHLSEGRYFGLLSNFVADPNYVGPNAPGLAAMSVTGSSAGGGLATATTSTTSSTSGLTGGGMTMILSASFHCAAAAPSSKDGDLYGNNSTRQSQPQTKPSNEKSDDTADSKGASTLVEFTSDGGESSRVPDDPKAEAADATTRSAPDLRKIMEDESSSASTMTFRDCIVRAAVYAGRTDRKETSFRGPNGETYPDLGKAFALYSGVKPCERCKNNKQGVFHCRIRRRHTDVDFDGGSSMAILKPLFDAPLDSLLLDG